MQNIFFSPVPVPIKSQLGLNNKILYGYLGSSLGRTELVVSAGCMLHILCTDSVVDIMQYISERNPKITQMLKVNWSKHTCITFSVPVQRWLWWCLHGPAGGEPESFLPGHVQSTDPAVSSQTQQHGQFGQHPKRPTLEGPQPPWGHLDAKPPNGPSQVQCSCLFAASVLREWPH